MAQAGRTRQRRERTGSSRRPERSRKDGRRASLRRGGSPARGSGAAKVLGLSTTRRAAVVAIVVCALAFTIAVPLRTYLSQRADLSVQQQQQAELEAKVTRLEQRKAELADPTQVEAEARQRLRFVMPGETPYMVQLPGDEPRGEGGNPPAPQDPAGAWYARLWASVAGG